MTSTSSRPALRLATVAGDDLAAAIDAFLSQPGLAPTTRAKYRQTLAVVEHELGDAPVTGAGLADVVAQRWHHASPATWNRHVATVRSFSRYCATTGLLEIDGDLALRVAMERKRTLRGYGQLRAARRLTAHFATERCAGTLRPMPTLVLGTPPPELVALLERRRQAGVDRLDEVWQGVRHMVPGPSIEHADISQQLAVLLDGPARAAGLRPTMSEFNLGESEHDFRVPDGGLHRPGASGVWQATAALVVEILSPGDESWQKLPFYAAHNVDEILIVDLAEQTVTWLALRDGQYEPIERSALIKLGPAELGERLNWP